MTTTVVHIEDAPFGSVYIGRKRRRMHYGNPFGRQHVGGGCTRSEIGCLVILPTTDRDATIAAYDDWLEGTRFQDVEPERRQWILDHLPRLKGKMLACWCSPRSCHGDVLARRADAT